MDFCYFNSLEHKDHLVEQLLTSVTLQRLVLVPLERYSVCVCVVCVCVVCACVRACTCTCVYVCL